MKVAQSCVVGTCGVMDPHGVGLDADEGSLSGASAQTPLLSCQLVWLRPWLPAVGALVSRVGPAKQVEISGECVVAETAPGSRSDGAQAVMMKTVAPANMAAVHADMLCYVYVIVMFNGLV